MPKLPNSSQLSSLVAAWSFPSVCDARVEHVLPGSCHSLAAGEIWTAALDDKVTFSELAKNAGLTGPDTRRMTLSRRRNTNIGNVPAPCLGRVCVLFCRSGHTSHESQSGPISVRRHE
jgi:hypothetical protein